MLIDFAKLNDPEHIEKLRREREAAQAVQMAIERRRRAAVRMLLLEDPVLAALSDKERSFARSVERRLNSSGYLTDPQHNWLFDIAKRFGTTFESAPGCYAFSLAGRLITVHGIGLADRAVHTTEDTMRAWAGDHGVDAREADAAFAGHVQRAGLAAGRPGARSAPSFDA